MRDSQEESTKRILESLLELNRDIEDTHNELSRGAREIEERRTIEIERRTRELDERTREIERRTTVDLRQIVESEERSREIDERTREIEERDERTREIQRRTREVERRTREIEERTRERTREIEEISREIAERRSRSRDLRIWEGEGEDTGQLSVTGHSITPSFRLDSILVTGRLPESYLLREYNDRFVNPRSNPRSNPGVLPVNSRNTSEVQRLQLNNTRPNERHQGETDRTVGNLTTSRQRPDIYRTNPQFPSGNQTHDYYHVPLENQTPPSGPPRVVSELTPIPPIIRTLDIEPSLEPSEITLWRNTRRDAVDYSNSIGDEENNPLYPTIDIATMQFTLNVTGNGNGNGNEYGYGYENVNEREDEFSNLENVKVPTDIKTLIEKTKVKICEKSDDNCAICQEKYKSQDIVRHINDCKHLYHIECIDKWFSENHTCPECRFDVNEIDRSCAA
jgi:hypothetical protein